MLDKNYKKPILVRSQNYEIDLSLYPLIFWLRPVGCCLPYEPSNFEKKGSPYTPISFANFTSLFPSSVRLLYTLFLIRFRATSPRFCALRSSLCPYAYAPNLVSSSLVGYPLPIPSVFNNLTRPLSSTSIFSNLDSFIVH